MVGVCCVMLGMNSSRSISVILSRAVKSVDLRFCSLCFFGLGAFWGSGWIEGVDYDLMSVFEDGHTRRWRRAKRGSLRRQRLGATFGSRLALPNEIMKDLLLWYDVPVIDGLA